MITIEINNYIDFSKLFFDLYKECEDAIVDDHIENMSLGLLMQFMAVHKDEFEIMTEECQFSDKDIIFVFGYDFGDANEGCNQSTTADYVFVYDRLLEQFVDAEYNQG